jgi:hypothetical protein
MKGDKMKKLLLVLLLVALAAFILVGCTPGTVTPVTTAGADCPTKVEVSGEVVIGTKTYIQGNSEEPKTITVTFAVPTAPVAVYVGGIAVGNEVVMYTTDNKVYTGSHTFTGDCLEGYIYVDTCVACDYCKYPYIVDSLPPAAKIEICSAVCPCGCEISFTSTTTEACDPTVNCGDDCSGLATWTIDLYDGDPGLTECCDASCAEVLDHGEGTACPIDWTTKCIDLEELYGHGLLYAIVTLTDKVGNENKFGWYFVLVPSATNSCDLIGVAEEAVPTPIINDCLETGDAVFCTCTCIQ